jgi:hypothetical protein
MDALEGLLHLIAFLFRSVVVLFDVLDLLQLLHGIVSFISEMMSRLWNSIPWFRRRADPKAVIAAVKGNAARRRTGPLVAPPKSRSH